MLTLDGLVVLEAGMTRGAAEADRVAEEVRVT